MVWGIIEGYDAKPPIPATVTEIKGYKEWMNRHRISRSTILLGMEPRLQGEYMGVKDARGLWEKLATTYRTKLQLNAFDIREDLLNFRLEGCENVDSYVPKIDEKVSAYNLCADSTGTTATGGDDSDTISKMSKQEHVFYLLGGVPRNDDWEVFLEVLRNKPDLHVKPEKSGDKSWWLRKQLSSGRRGCQRTRKHHSLRGNPRRGSTGRVELTRKARSRIRNPAMGKVDEMPPGGILGSAVSAMR